MPLTTEVTPTTTKPNQIQFYFRKYDIWSHMLDSRHVNEQNQSALIKNTATHDKNERKKIKIK